MHTGETVDAELRERFEMVGLLASELPKALTGFETDLHRITHKYKDVLDSFYPHFVKQEPLDGELPADSIWLACDSFISHVQEYLDTQDVEIDQEIDLIAAVCEEIIDLADDKDTAAEKAQAVVERLLSEVSGGSDVISANLLERGHYILEQFELYLQDAGDAYIEHQSGIGRSRIGVFTLKYQELLEKWIKLNASFVAQVWANYESTDTKDVGISG